MSELIHILGINLLVASLYMTAWFALSYFRKRLDVVDTAWGGGFILIAYGCFVRSPSFYSFVVAIMVAVWGLRLALHILHRNKRKQNDPRYDALSEKWSPRTFWFRAYLSIFLLQGLLITIISMPVATLALPGAQHSSSLLAVGTLVWLVGFVIEVTADTQLGAFLRRKSPSQSVMDTGIWRYSRHPNYFGEIMVWWGIGIVAYSGRYGWIGLLGPLAITYLIVFVSGIPPLEKRKKDDPAYQEYARRTSVLIPLPPKS